MKAISIKEPWASLIFEGKKIIETRTWKTNHRGKILLCASKNPKTPLSGFAFAVANLVNIKPMEKEDEEDACCEVYPRAYSWILDSVEIIDKFEVKGQLGLFEVPLKDEKYLEGLKKLK